MLLKSDDREVELRAHIRSLLSQYAATHLVTNHLAWTEAEVANGLSECLHPIPMTDRNAIALPLDPLEILSQRLNLPNMDLYEERWKVVDKDAVAYLKRQMVAMHGRSEGAERHWRNDDDDAFSAFLLRRPMSTILSVRARKETPQPGKVKRAKDIVIEETPVHAEEVLRNKLPMDAATHHGVLSLMKAIPSLANTARISDTHNFDEFLRSSSPPLDLPELEILPVFSRTERLGQRSGGYSSSTVVLDAIGKASGCFLSRVKMRDEDEEDLTEEHLVVVDGWQAFQTSSPSTPSLADSSSDVDQLFMVSSPGSESFRIDKLQMEVPQMPRSGRVGGAREKASLPGQGNKLSDFLPPLVRPAQSRGPRIVHSPKSQPSSPRTSIAISLLGQLSSVPNVPDAIVRSSGDATNPSSDDSIAFAVKTVERACGDGVGSEDPTHIVLLEKLDEKDGMLMDVPLMRSPSEHPIGDFILPCRLNDLLVPKATSARKLEAGKSFLVGLKKARGLQPLQIELSWIPFKYGRTVPTDEEVADVQNDPCPQLAKDIDLAQDEIVSRLAVLLDESMAFGSQPASAENAPSSNVWLSDRDDTGDTVERYSFELEQILILTRQDRRRLAELPPFSDDLCNTGSYSQSSTTVSTPGQPNVIETLQAGVKGAHDESVRPVKRVRFQDPAQDEPSAVPTQVTSTLEESYSYVDDSGVVFYDSVSDSAILSGNRHSFGRLAYDSEGFVGPSADGDLFQDVHSVHSCDYRFDYTPDPYLQGFLPPYESDTDILSPLLSDCDNLHGRHAEEVERSSAWPPVHQLATHDRRAVLPPTPASLPAPLCHSTAVLSTLTDHHPATFGSVLPNIPDVRRGSARAAPEQSVVFARPSLSHFLAICGKGSLAASSVAMQTSASVSQPIQSSPDGVLEVQVQAPLEAAYRSKDTPLELINTRTLVLPAHCMSPNVGHRYMASLRLIQKRALVRALASFCAVDLVEREHLGPDAEDVDLILDCETAALFISVESLPRGGEAVTVSLTQLSWRFSRLLLVFECYPSSWSSKGDQDLTDKLVANAWSPPVVKAVKKIRRNLAIADGIQTKRAATIVEYAFANTPHEAAVFARMYGDMAETRDETGGALWGERVWLTHDERDGECDLGGVNGMNVFVASLLLYRTTLEDFLEKSADDRLLEYADLVGIERMTRFNVEMARRLESMQLPPSSPIDIATSSSSRDIGDSEVSMY